jgi:glucose-1-phosphate adenylyltransferase
MILVGGQGTRLKELTRDIAKPAVSFGGKYRLIDFTLSNLTNSQIDIVGLVTQYEPYDLMRYIGRGASWDLDTIDGGIAFLTPYAKNGDVLWQKGTAHAIAQYFNFVKEHQADRVLILSGDQIYKMNYQELIKDHLTHDRQVTIAATHVPLEEAPRFGILETDGDGLIVSFEEKPKKPKGTLASMGIYLFNTGALETLLSGADSAESIDFGKNVIPKAIASKLRVGAYVFEGYWRDVGTVESLYAANMDMLDDPNFLSLNVSKHLPVYSKSLNYPPHVVLDDGEIKGSVVADGSAIDGVVVRSTIGYRVQVRKNARVENCVVFPGVVVGEGARIKNAVVNKDVVIPEGFVFEPERVAILDRTAFEKDGEKR